MKKRRPNMSASLKDNLLASSAAGGAAEASPVMGAVAWPPDCFSEIKRRVKLLRDYETDVQRQSRLMAFYRTHPHEWIADFCVTFDPRIMGRMKTIPFMLFPKQKKFVTWLVQLWQNGLSGLAEKCRDIGATWLCCAFSVWLWLFHPGSAIGWGSRKKELVDNKGDPKAIFTKIRQIIRTLPEWMRPNGFVWRTCSSDMKILNPENDATIIGECGDQIGRGGRTTIYFKDESAHYERPEEIEAALGDNTNVQVDISSVNGSDNVFYRRRMAGVVWNEGDEMQVGKTSVFIFDWRDHPGKNQEWYDLRRAKAEAEGLLHIFAQEVERDYSGSRVGIIIKAEWVRACIDADKILAARLPEAHRAEYLASWRRFDNVAGQDIADGGNDRNALVGRHGRILDFGAHWGGEAGEAADIAVPTCGEKGFTELYYDCIGVGAGFKTGVNQLKQKPNWPPRLRVYKWDASAAPLDPEDHIIPGDEQSPTNEDQYGNLKAQSWFRARAMFYKTWRAVTKGAIYPVGELISISSEMEHIHELVMELSQPVSKTSASTGKTIVDKKPEGARSPNLADGAIMCLNPAREVGILDVL
jgi:phage terminase large subunit